MSRSDTEAYSVLEERYLPYFTGRARLERNWSLNKSYILGNHWHQWNARTWALQSPSEKSRWKIRPVRNFCRPWQERTIAQMTDFEPRWGCHPATNDIEDEQAARLSTKITKGYWRKLEMSEIIQLWSWWATCCGTSYLKTNWNPHAGAPFAGPMIHESRTGKLTLVRGEDGEPLEDTYYPGDIEVSCPSPFTIFQDPLATEDQDVLWMMEVTRRPLNWIDRYFPDKAPYVRPDNSVVEPKYRSRGLFYENGLFGTGHDTSTTKDWTTYKEYYEKPSPLYPRGRFIASAGNVILINDDNPTPDYGFPYIKLKRLIVGDSIYGDTELSDLRDVNRNYNRLVAKRLEHVYLMGSNAKVLVNQMMGLPEASFVSTIGEIIKYAGNQPPQYLVPPPLSPESAQELNRHASDFDQVGNTYGPERGQYQGKLSGTALQLLVEQAFKGKKPGTIRMRNALIKWGQLVLKLVQEHVDEERMIAISGRASQSDVIAFTGADIAGQTDLFIELDSLLPKSRAMALQDITVMQQTGMMNPAMDPKDRADAMAMIDKESSDEVLEDRNLETRWAKKEGQMLMRGEWVDPKPYEDHDVHAMQHRLDMLSDEYRDLPVESQQPLLKHYQGHLEMAMPKPGVTLPPDQQAQLAAAGAPAGGGGG